MHTKVFPKAVTISQHKKSALLLPVPILRISSVMALHCTDDRRVLFKGYGRISIFPIDQPPPRKVFYDRCCSEALQRRSQSTFSTYIILLHLHQTFNYISTFSDESIIQIILSISLLTSEEQMYKSWDCH